MARASARIDRRALNRATLARQLLVARERGAVGAVARVVGVQAQLPRPAFVGLWTRTRELTRADVAGSLERRELVRATLMRATLHLCTAADYPAMRAAIAPALEKAQRAILKQRGASLDAARLVDEARPLLAESPRTFEEIRAHLAAMHPEADERAMGYAIRTSLPLVQVPDGGAWSFPTAPRFALADTWLGTPIDLAAREPDELVRRYLAAYGPSTLADIQAWTGLPGLRASTKAMGDELRTFRDEKGSELFDLAGSPLPGPDLDVPVRFLPEWDNAIVARSDDRLLAGEHRAHVFRPGLRVLATLLVDGFVAGTWSITRKKSIATLEITPFTTIPKKTRSEIEREGDALVAFVEPDAPAREVRFGGL